VLSATFHNTAINEVGLIELTFNENGFEGKWKKGLEPGPMRGKWSGKLYLEFHSKENSATDNSSTELSDEQIKYLEEGIWLRDFNGEEEDQIKKKSWLNKQSFLLEALKQNGSILQYAPENFKANKTIILEAVKNNGIALEFASENLKKDREIVLTAVANNGGSLKFASENFKKDREIVLNAIKNDNYFSRVLESVSEELKSDKEIILEALKKDGKALSHASDNLKNDREVVLEAIKKDNKSIQFASDELNGDPEIILAALAQDSYALYYIRSEVILKEIAQNSSVGKKKINFKVRDLVNGGQKLFEKKLFDENGDVKDEFESICNEWFDFNQIIYQNQKMDGDALLSLAQVQFNEYRPSPTDGRDVEEYTRDLLNEAIDLNDEALGDIIKYGLRPEEYLDFSELAEKACELLWNKSEKSYADALMVIGTDDDEFEIKAGISKEFAKKIIKEAREVDSGEEEDKENFENFVSETDL
jgi:hypothetical protein